MTRTRYRIFETDYPYFLTCTIVGWLPIFTRPEAVEIVLESWRYLQRERGMKLFGYVILENHLHMIASAPELRTVVQNCKLEYMHNNPVVRGYVDDPLHWRYSSARNYAGQVGLIEVLTDWR